MNLTKMATMQRCSTAGTRKMAPVRACVLVIPLDFPFPAPMWPVACPRVLVLL